MQETLAAGSLVAPSLLVPSLLVPSLLEYAALGAAAFAAGVVNAMAGGGTLLTFPVLLAVGLDPRSANATSTLALWPWALGSAYGFRRELADREVWPVLWRLVVPSALGGAAGTALVIYTPPSAFEAVVPWLVLVATALFAAQARLGAALRRRSEAARDPRLASMARRTTIGLSEPSPAPGRRRFNPAVFLAALAVAVYGGYFGAGLGILLLTVLGLLGVANLHAANGLKALLGLLINGVAALGFAFSSLIHWPIALAMCVTSIAGGYAGASLARRVGPRHVRRLVVVVGASVGGLLLYRQYF